MAAARSRSAHKRHSCRFKSDPRQPMVPLPSLRHMHSAPSSPVSKLQSLLHEPQVAPSSRFTQLPLQQPESAKGQTLPHALQLSLLVIRLTHVPLQHVSPAAHAGVHSLPPPEPPVPAMPGEPAPPAGEPDMPPVPAPPAGIPPIGIMVDMHVPLRQRSPSSQDSPHAPQ